MTSATTHASATPTRAAADGALASVLTSIFATRGAEEWEGNIGAARRCLRPTVPKTSDPRAAATMSGISEFTLTDPVIRELGFVAEVEHPLLGRISRHGAPIQFSETPGRIAPGCRTGQHTEAILTELGYSAYEIAWLHADDIVAMPS